MKKNARVFLCLLLVILAACNTPAEETSIPAPVPIPLPTGAVSRISCADQEPALVTGFDVLQVPLLSEPEARLPFRDPVFGTCLVRVTDRNADMAEGDASQGLKNEYSRIQSFNADETLILVRGLDATWYLYDAASLRPLGQLPFDGSVDPQWSASDPGLIYYIEETRLQSYHIQSGEQSIVHDFSADFPGQTISAVWTRHEGSPSYDGDTWGLMVEDENWLTSAFLVYDLPSDRVISILDTRSWPEDAREIDSVTISPLGKTFLAYLDKYCEPGQLGTQAAPLWTDGLRS